LPCNPVAAFDVPSSNVDGAALRGVEDDVVQDVLRLLTELRQTLPVVAAVLRHEQLACAGTEQDVIGILRIDREAAHVATIRADGPPRCSPCRAGHEQHQERKLVKFPAHASRPNHIK
jgi:hypothetical protein